MPAVPLTADFLVLDFSNGRKSLQTRYFSLCRVYFLRRRVFLHTATNYRQNTEQVKATTLDSFSVVCSQMSL